MKIIELVLASDYEEFYFENSHEVVPEGDPVGINIDEGGSIKLCLFDDVYHQFKYEEGEG